MSDRFQLSAETLASRLTISHPGTCRRSGSHLRRNGRHPLRSLSDSSSDLLNQQIDDQPGASSAARSEERRELESAAIVRCLGQIVRGLEEKGDWARLKVLELLWVKGWANREVAAF